MRKRFSQTVLALLLLLVFYTHAAAQLNSPGGTSLGLTNDPGGPAPRQDLNGTWVGPIDRATGETPQFTPLGQKLFNLNKPEVTFKVSGTNDPFLRNCDPMGFPRSMIFESRGVPVGEMLRMTIATLPGRTLVLSQFQQVWRQIWTDGRALPTNVGGREKNAPDARYFGYSVGHWQGDNVFVADTTGADDSTWLSKAGYPHTVESHFQERYTRSSHNDMQLTITVDDPKLYVKPFALTVINFKWLPDQSLDEGEWLCVPSQLIDYLKLIGDQAN